MVTIVGRGMYSSIGKSITECWKSVLEGRIGVTQIKRFDLKRFDLHVAYEIQSTQNKTPYEWLIKAIEEAIKEARCQIDADTVVIVGTGLRNLREFEKAIESENTCISKTEIDFSLSLYKHYPQMKNFYSVSNACSSSLYALALGFDILNLKQAKRVVVCGIDGITKTMHALADRMSVRKTKVIEPFDTERNGTLLGEGAAAIVIENKENAENKDIVIEHVILSCDATHETQPNQERIEQTVREALKAGNLSATDIDLIITHGTGTALNDSTEGKVLQTIFNDHEKNIILEAPKSMLGHTSGASGLMSVVLATQVLLEEKAFPIPTLNSPIQEIRKFNLGVQPQKKKIKNALVNAFGFGGVNAITVLRKICNE